VATEQTEHAAGAEHAIRFAPFDQVDTFPSQIFWLVVTFGVLYFVLAQRLLPKLARAIEERSSVIASNVAAAASASQRADDSVRDVEARIGEARARARATAAAAKAEADAKSAEASARAESVLNERLAAAEARIAAVRASAMANVASIAAEAAAAMTERLSGAPPSRDEVSRAVERAMGG
jgi:F-type H+-transporting ATPase subunit b